MQWIKFIVITLAAILILVYEYTKLEQSDKKEKIAVGMLLIVIWLLAGVLVIWGDQLVSADRITQMYKPIQGILE